LRGRGDADGANSLGVCGREGGARRGEAFRVGARITRRVGEPEHSAGPRTASMAHREERQKAPGMKMGAAGGEPPLVGIRGGGPVNG
jgi:hypothetical protein